MEGVKAGRYTDVALEPGWVRSEGPTWHSRENARRCPRRLTRSQTSTAPSPACTAASWCPSAPPWATPLPLSKPRPAHRKTPCTPHTPAAAAAQQPPRGEKGAASRRGHVIRGGCRGGGSERAYAARVTACQFITIINGTPSCALALFLSGLPLNPKAHAKTKRQGFYTVRRVMARRCTLGLTGTRGGTSPWAKKTRLRVRRVPGVGLDGDEERRRVRVGGDCTPTPAAHRSVALACGAVASHVRAGGQSARGARQAWVTPCRCRSVVSGIHAWRFKCRGAPGVPWYARVGLSYGRRGRRRPRAATAPPHPPTLPWSPSPTPLYRSGTPGHGTSS